MAGSRHILAVGAPIANASTSSRDVATILDERVAARIASAEASAYEAGRTEALAAVGPQVDAVVERLEAFRHEATEEVARDTVELAVEIARQLVQCQVHAGDYDLERMVRGALDAADVGRGTCTVHVAPADHERLNEVPFREGTRVVADPEMRPGDLHVATPRGLLVRELEPTLDAIREQLLEELA